MNAAHPTAPQIILHQFVPPPGMLNFSPFCLKLETWLKLVGLPYQVVAVGDPAEGPKGKAPWIVDATGRSVADSTLVIDHLIRLHGHDPDARLTPRERAVSTAVTALVEERLYFALLWCRWIDPANWQVLKPAYFGDLPEAIRDAVADGSRAGVEATLKTQGLGRHSPEEIAWIGVRDVQALAALLADRPWLAGEHPGTADCTAWAMVVNLLTPMFDHPLRRAAEASPDLLAYYRRGLERWFPDLATAQAD